MLFKHGEPRSVGPGDVMGEVEDLQARQQPVTVRHGLCAGVCRNNGPLMGGQGHLLVALERLDLEG